MTGASGMSGTRGGRPMVRRARRLLKLAGRWAERLWGPLVLALGLLLLGSGGLSRRVAAGERALPVLQLLLAMGLLVGKSAQRLRLLRVGRRGRPSASPRRLELLQIESGAALLLATFSLLQALGGARSPLHPLVYALTAFLVSQHRRRVAIVLCGLTLLCQGLLFLGDGVLGAQWVRLGLHSVFILLFSALHLLFFRGELWRQRREHDERLGGELQRMQQEAFEFRLMAAQPSGPAAASGRAHEEGILAQGAVAVIHESLRTTIGLLRRSLNAAAAALYWLDPAGERLRLKEGQGEQALVDEVAADAGALGMIVKSRAPLSLPQPKAGHLPYLKDAAALGAGAFLGVPILEEGQVLGVLCVDRRAAGAAPFSPDDEALLVEGAAQVLRTLQSERVFAAVERSRYEHQRLYRASERLNRALTMEQVHKEAFQAAAEICEFDFAAITTYDRAARRHSVVATAKEEALGEPPGDPLLGLGFSDNAGLVAMAVKNRHHLPLLGAQRAEKAPVFDDRPRLRGMESLLVLPLICGGEAVGAVCVASRTSQRFGREQREMLGVLCNQVAVSMENARMYQAMEAMATTDGLTALTNRRAFQDRFEEMLQRAERQGGALTLVLTDIDHFKKINDTYGHPVGDVVLKRVAQVVQSCMRKIDMAARYGGEEFAVVLEMTDRAGGRQLAERVRREVQQLCFQSDKGPFQCTLSLGMATFPGDGRDARTLIAHADQALYSAKHNGRNQSVAFEDLAERPRAAS